MGQFTCGGKPAEFRLELQGGTEGYKYINVACCRCWRQISLDLRPQSLSTLVHEELHAASACWNGRRFVTTPKSKGGRPSKGEPWKALGISERTYYRRQKTGKL